MLHAPTVPMVFGDGLLVGQGQNYNLRVHSKCAIQFLYDREKADLSLSEILKRTKWDKLLPEPAVLAPYIREDLANPTFRVLKISSEIIIISCIGYVLQSLILFIKFIAYIPKVDGYESSKDFSESILDPMTSMIITLVTAITALWVLYIGRKINNDKFEDTLEKYKILRNEIVVFHKLEIIFFQISEILCKLHSSNPISLESLNHINKVLQKILHKVKPQFDLFAETPFLQRSCFIDTGFYVDKLKILLCDEVFEDVLDEIKKNIKIQIVILERNNIPSNPPKIFHKDLCGKVDNDQETCHAILNAISDIATTKSKISRSTLTKVRSLVDEQTLDAIKGPLTTYWNLPTNKTSLYHPNVADLPFITEKILIYLNNNMPHILFQMPRVQSTQLHYDTYQVVPTTIQAPVLASNPLLRST